MRTHKLWLILFCVIFLTGCGCEVEKQPRPTDKPELVDNAVDTEKLIAETIDATTEIELFLFNLDAANRDWQKAETHRLELEKTLRAIDTAILDVSRRIAKGNVLTRAHPEMHIARARLFECRGLILLQIYNVSNVDIYEEDVDINP